MISHRIATLFCALTIGSSEGAFADSINNKSIEGNYKTTAHFCIEDKCDDQSETLESAFFLGGKNVHIYAGANKGMVLPFGRQAVSTDGKTVWMTPTPAGFDETYARDGFTITHHYAIKSDGTCSVSVSVLKAPAKTSTAYRTNMVSCKVTEGNAFASR